MKERIKQLTEEIKALQMPQHAEEVEALRLKYLSKKGLLNQLMAEFKDVPSEEKKEIGILVNQLKQLAINTLDEMKRSMEANAYQEQIQGVDLSRSEYPIPLGTRHPLSLVRDEVIRIFSRLGFNVADGPEIEDDWHVFESLNFAEDHPARDMQDTFFIAHNPEVLLRTHTSSVQTRIMERSEPPIRILCPGRVYRNEAISSRAHCFFHQVEALYIAEDVSFADLRQVLMHFASELFGPDTKIRLRPSYFPFTEPSAEMDISCKICNGAGCALCKGSGWVEILGCGMVDSAVLESCGIDSNKYSGYALGMGVERIANLKYNVSDLRLFSENDLRFLRQFVSAR